MQTPLQPRGGGLQWERTSLFVSVVHCVVPRASCWTLHGLGQFLQKGREDPDCPFIVIPLLGRFKGEEHFRQHLLISASKTGSGFQPRKWLEALVGLHQQEQRTQGPAICDDDSFIMKQSVLNAAFLSCLEAVLEDSPELFPPGLSVSDYDVNRSIRRGSDSRAKALGTDLQDINAMNRWKVYEQAQGKRPLQSMSDSYADVELLRPMFIRYTRDL